VPNEKKSILSHVCPGTFHRVPVFLKNLGYCLDIVRATRSRQLSTLAFLVVLGLLGLARTYNLCGPFQRGCQGVGQLWTTPAHPDCIR
jgi:hypothetical protein